MLKIDWFQILFRLLPETFTLTFIIYTLSGEHIQKKKYISTSLILSFFVYASRMLPIFLGVHTVINIVVYISAFIILGISLVKAIKNTFIAVLILELCELLNLFLNLILNIDVSKVSNTYLKTLYGMPSLILFIIISLILKYKLKNRMADNK